MDVARGGDPLDRRLFPVSGLQSADVTHDAGGAGCRVLSGSGPPSGDPVQHDRVQLVRRVPRPDSGSDRAADPQDGTSDADLLLRDAGLRGRRPDSVSRRQRLLAAGRLSSGAQPGADSAAQRFRLDNLHHRGPVSDRAKRNPGPGNLFRRSATSGIPPLGGSLQPSGGGRVGARCLRRRVIDRPAGVGRLPVVLGEERCHCGLDRRDGRRVGTGHLSGARREPRARQKNWSTHERGE